MQSYFENVFKDPETLEKYNQRTNLDIKEECPRCGISCEDLYMHIKECQNEQKNYQEREIDVKKIGSKLAEIKRRAEESGILSSREPKEKDDLEPAMKEALGFLQLENERERKTHRKNH